MLQAFLQDYGYLALFIGTFFEGETILVLAGFLASRGFSADVASRVLRDAPYCAAPDSED